MAKPNVEKNSARMQKRQDPQQGVSRSKADVPVRVAFEVGVGRDGEITIFVLGDDSRFVQLTPARSPSPVSILRAGEDVLAKIATTADAWIEPLADSHPDFVRQADLRRGRIEAFGRAYGLLSASQVAALAGSKSTNRSATATRWRAQRRIFSVDIHGQLRFPGFQFDGDGKPKAAIEQVIKRIGIKVPGWNLALWFDTPHFALPKQSKPVDLLDRSPNQVVDAAMCTARELADTWG